MAKNLDYTRNIKDLVNNEKEIQKLLDHSKALSESLEKSKQEADKAYKEFHEAIEILDDGFVIYDKEDRLVLYNEAFKKQFGTFGRFLKEGRTYEEMTLQIASAGIIPNIEGKEDEFVTKLIEQRKTDEGVEKTFQTEDGKWIRQRDKKALSGNMIGLRTNITELKEREEELAHASKMFTEATSAMVQGIVIFEADKLQFFNPNLAKLLNISQEDLKIGFSFSEFLNTLKAKGHYDNDDKVVQKNIQMMLSKEKHQLERATHYGTYLRVDVIPEADGKVILTYTDITDMKNNEANLKETKDILQATTDAMVQGMIVFEKGKLSFYNPKLLSVLQLKEKELPKDITFEAYMEVLRAKGQLGEGDESHQNLRDILKLAKDGKHYSIERSLSKTKHIKVDTVPRDTEYSLVITYTDISVLKNRETELELLRLESEASLVRQSKIANAIAQGIVMFENNKVVFFNQQAIDTLELPENILFEEQTFEKFLSMQIKDNHFGSQQEGEAFVAQHMNIITTGIPYQLERVTKSGKTIRVDGVPNKQENSLTLTFTDISTLKERELELNVAKIEAEKASEIQAASANAMVQGLLFFNEDKLEYFNPKFLELTGIESSEIYKGMTAFDIRTSLFNYGEFNDNESIENYDRKIESKFNSGEAFTLERKMKNGKVLKVETAFSHNNGVVATYSDITDSRTREQALQETMKVAESAERAKSEFLANMSHEIRTPMNGVMGMAELLATTELDAKQKMFADVIIKSGASLLTIINDILDFSKIDAGQMELNSAPFNLAEAIEDVATLVSSKVAEKDLELIVRVAPDLPSMLIGDVGRIRQIVTNLLGNAVKFTEKGHIFVNIEGTTTSKNDINIASLKFSIEDTGIGIPTEKCSQIFQKFSQVDNSATRKHEGTGLGLSISSSLVNLMGGEIGVESGIGKGSTFWFTIEMPVHGKAVKLPVVPGDLTGSRILVIDDNKVNRSILAEQMSAWHFDGACTSSGEEGLDVMRAVIANGMKLDLVILDYQMPEMSGAAVLEIMRNDEMLNDIPVLMLTSVDSSKTNQRLIELGAEANLTKPTRSSMLLETILHVIANKRADLKTTPVPELPLEVNGNLTPIKANIQNQQLDILVAEDNEVNQIVFKQILEESGLNFKIVENGRLALATYKVQKPHLILMDVSMPEMNGKEATVAIRKYERDNEMKRTPIVGVTAHALKGDMESCIDAGMDDYLSKPVSPKKLSLKIEQWLKVNLSNSATG